MNHDTEISGLLRMSPDAIAIVHAGGIVDTNAALQRMFGYPGHLLRGAPLSLLLPHFTLPPHAAQDSGPLQTVEMEVRNAHGACLAVEVAWTWLTAPDGSAGHDGPTAVLSLRETTARRRAQDALQQACTAAEQAHQQLAQISDTLPLALFQLETSGEQVLRYHFLSQTVQRLLGISTDQVLRDAAQLLSPMAEQDTARIQQALQQAIGRVGAGEREVQFDLTVRAQVHAQVRSLLIYMALGTRRANGNLLWNGYLQDVTAIEDAQAALRTAKQQAQGSARAKAQFLAQMGQEIRSPMNTILGVSHLLQKSPLNPSQRDAVQKIQRASQHLMGLVNDVLELSKVEGGAVPMDHTDFELRSVLEKVADSVADSARAKDLELVFHVDARLPDCLQGDPMRLAQVLLHYATNAVKFTDKGEICISVAPLAQTDTHITLRFAVRDTGVGLSAAQIAQLFQTFAPNDSAQTRPHGGTGLGLAIAKSLAELMQGEVGVESVPGEGSTFWFTAQLGRGTQRTHSLPPPAMRGRRVLVVDDNESARLVLSELLSRMAFDVEVFDNGLAAIAALQRASKTSRPYDLVFLDWRMGRLDGLEVARRMLAMQLPQAPKIALLSNFVIDELRERAVVYGIREVLPKPLQANALHAAVHRMLTQSEGAAKEQQPSPQQAKARVVVVAQNAEQSATTRTLLADAGLEVSCVADLHQVLQRFYTQGQASALVVMDLPLPLSEGVEAVRALRAHCPASVLPLIAIGPITQSEERALCFASGIQEVLALPLDPQALQAAVARCLVERTIPSPPAILELAGLDTRLGLQRVLGRSDRYLSMLSKFHDHYAGVTEVLRQQLQERNMGAVSLTCLGLERSSNNIGAMQVHTCAIALTQALQQPLSGPRESALQALEHALAPLLQGIAAHFAKLPPVAAPSTPAAGAGSPPVGASNTDPAHALLVRVVQGLMGLLKNDDASALELFNAQSALLQQALPRDIRALEAAICAFDFAQAVAILARAQVPLESASDARE